MPVLVSMQPNGSTLFLREANPAANKPVSTAVIQNGRVAFTVGSLTATAYVGNDHTSGLKELAATRERVIHPEIKSFLQEIANLLDPERIETPTTI